MKTEKQVKTMVQDYEDRLCRDFGFKTKKEAAADLNARLKDLMNYKLTKSFEEQFADNTIETITSALKMTKGAKSGKSGKANKV